MRAPTPSAAAEIVVPDRNELLQRVDEICTRMDNAMDKQIYKRRTRIDAYSKEIKFLSPAQKLDRIKEQLERKKTILSDTMNTKLGRAADKLSSLVSLLDAMNPLGVLQRGYSMTENESGDVVSSVNAVECGEHIKLTFRDGRVYVTIDSIETEDAELKGDLVNG
jgi:exodeoxyribonuclease VII large subunit